MRDPHVDALIYNIEHDNSVDYSQATPVDEENDSFQIRVENKTVCLKFKDHYATETEARTAVKSYIRSWELDAALRGQPGQFRLSFARSRIVDRNPYPLVPGDVNLAGTLCSGAPTLNGTLSVIVPKEYPQPPTGLKMDPFNPDVSTIYQRFERCLEGKEPLPGMANLCLNMLENRLSKNRTEAARKYGISLQVLNKIGNLVTNKGGPEAARKASGVGNKLTSEESRFLEEAVKKIILRVAKVAHNPRQQLRKIALTDLPQLPK